MIKENKISKTLMLFCDYCGKQIVSDYYNNDTRKFEFSFYRSGPTHACMKCMPEVMQEDKDFEESFCSNCGRTITSNDFEKINSENVCKTCYDEFKKYFDFIKNKGDRNDKSYF